MNFSEWMNSLGMNRMRFGLSNITELLERLGNPHRRFRSVHVAGSDGKGSTCAMIYSVLLNAGIRTGLYTSPHLIEFNERISVNGSNISNDDLIKIMGVVRPEAEAMASEGKDCTFFEVATAIAFLYFKRKRVDYAVLETGMGGRLDATNTVIPEITAITNISLEHTGILGDTIEKIAFEKAGIIKSRTPVVTANTGAALDVIKKVAGERGAPVVTVNRDDVNITSFKKGHVSMEYFGNNYEIGIPGRCQAENAAIAIECIRRIAGDVETAMTEGLKNVRWSGRMEYFPERRMIVDVTHTAAGAERLASDILETYGKVTLVLGMFNDKSAEEICRTLAPIADETIITMSSSERAMEPEMLAGIMKRYSDKVTAERDLGTAIASAAGKGTVLITGSLHLAGEALQCLKKV